MASESPVPILDVLSLVNIHPSTSRASFNINCPLCDQGEKNHREKHLNVNIEKDVWCCPKCGSGGGAVHLYGFLAHGTDPAIIKGNKQLIAQYLKEISEATGTVDLAQLKSRKVEVQKVDFPPTVLSERDFTYNCLLDKLSLSDSHMENLIRRGLRRSDIERNKYKSAPLIGLNKLPNELRMQDTCSLQGVPGFYKKGGQWTLLKQNPGIMIPVREVSDDFSKRPQGMIQGLQVRYDKEPRPGCKYMWYSTRDMTSGSGAETWAHFVGYPEKTIWLTEGPLKGDIANRFLDQPFICIPGVNALYHLEDSLKILMDYGVRHIKTAFDMDYKTNPHVQKAYANLVDMLHKLRLTYERVNWSEQYKGIDDYLLAMYLKNGGRLDLNE